MNEHMDMLIAMVSKRFPPEEENYPSLVGKNKEEKLIFNIRHQILHMGKRIGKFSTVIEGYEHGGKELDVKELKDNVANAIVDVLRIAEVIDMKGEEILAHIERKM